MVIAKYALFIGIYRGFTMVTEFRNKMQASDKNIDDLLTEAIMV